MWSLTGKDDVEVSFLFSTFRDDLAFRFSRSCNGKEKKRTKATMKVTLETGQADLGFLFNMVIQVGSKGSLAIDEL